MSLVIDGNVSPSCRDVTEHACSTTSEWEMSNLFVKINTFSRVQNDLRLRFRKVFAGRLYRIYKITLPACPKELSAMNCRLRLVGYCESITQLQHWIGRKGLHYTNENFYELKWGNNYAKDCCKVHWNAFKRLTFTSNRPCPWGPRNNLATGLIEKLTNRYQLLL